MTSKENISQDCILNIIYLPISGLSEVIGMIEDTVFKNIVRESRMVTPVRNLHYHYY
jgi:hypothetical protein